MRLHRQVSKSSSQGTEGRVKKMWRQRLIAMSDDRTMNAMMKAMQPLWALLGYYNMDMWR